MGCCFNLCLVFCCCFDVYVVGFSEFCLVKAACGLLYWLVVCLFVGLVVWILVVLLFEDLLL